MIKLSEPQIIAEMVGRLATTFSDLPPSDVDRVVREIHAYFDNAAVREFVPLLVERRVRTELVKRRAPVPAAASV